MKLTLKECRRISINDIYMATFKFREHDKPSPIIVFNKGTEYFNLFNNSLVDVRKLQSMEPMKNYYSKSDYFFIEKEGNVSLILDSFGPLHEYFSKHA